MDRSDVAIASRGKLAAAVALLRPHQWLKNGVVLAPLVFAHRLFVPHDVVCALGAMIAWCALASAGYVLNDLLDREADRVHPVKRQRPLAAGELTTAEGLGVLATSATIGIVLAFAIGPALAALGLVYVMLQYAYSTLLKRIVIVDVITVATGFILRAYAGGVAIGVEVSPWLALNTFLLALFLVLARRRQEVTSLGAVATLHREALADYSAPLLDQMMSVITAATLVAYMIYTVSPEVTGKLGTSYFHLTVPFVVFGMFRYLYLVHRRHAGDDPARLLLSDGPLLVSVVLWAIADVLLLYGHVLFGGR
jgi:4-hydroxybenzoate polyprenyltransferase